MTRIIVVFLLTWFLLSTYRADATHIVGGEIYYEKIGFDNYLVTLKIYRDCGPANTLGTGFDNIASVGVYQGNSLVQVLSMSLATAQVSTVPVILENPCFVVPPGVCVQEAIYTSTVTLPPSASGYVLMHQRCCRQPSIMNINFPDQTGATFWTQIPSSNITTVNSNPQFNSLPPVSLCAGAEFIFDHSATDTDGDSLVYEFCTPLLGGSTGDPAPAPGPPPPYTPISWGPGFNNSYQITADPEFTINPQTGLMSGTATQVGQYVIGVCVSEYRNGVLLSTTNRDFQFNVSLCEPTVVVSVPEQTQFCNGLTFSFTQNSTNAESFLWDFGDPTSDEDWSDEPEPTWTYADTGMYQVTLIANPGWTCADTTTVIYAAYPPINPQIDSLGFACVNGNGLHSYGAAGEFGESASFLWEFTTPGTTATATEQNPTVTLPAAQNINVALTVFENECESTVTANFTQPPPPTANVPDQTGFCTGLTYVFDNFSTNASEYSWDFGTGADDATSTLVNPEYTFPDTGVYTVTLTAGFPGACPNTTQATYAIYYLLDAWFDPPGGQCFSGNSFNFSGSGTEESQAIYTWTFEGNEMASFTGQTINGISWETPGTYDVELTIEANGCVDSISWPADVIPDPEIAFSGGGVGCPPLLVHFDNQSFTATTATYLWNFGDGNTSTLANPHHIYGFTGNFNVSLTMTTGGGCVQTLNAISPQAVITHPVPQAGLDIQPNVVNILEPYISIVNLSEGAISCSYYFGDGNFSDDCEPEHAYNGSGYFDVVQTVTNEFGCQATGFGQVLVEGTLFYAPNAFTPDNDGINDVWKPILTGYTGYTIEIYDRWGKVIFASEDAEEPWLGNVNNGAHFAQDGIYTYRCIIRDLQGLGREYSGHINLIR